MTRNENCIFPYKFQVVDVPYFIHNDFIVIFSSLVLHLGVTEIYLKKYKIRTLSPTEWKKECIWIILLLEEIQLCRSSLVLVMIGGETKRLILKEGQN